MELQNQLESWWQANRFYWSVEEKKSNIHLVDGGGEPIQLTKDKYGASNPTWHVCDGDVLHAASAAVLRHVRMDALPLCYATAAGTVGHARIYGSATASSCLHLRLQRHGTTPPPRCRVRYDRATAGATTFRLQQNTLFGLQRADILSIRICWRWHFVGSRLARQR
jgi:hypothetical protein